MNSVNKPLDSNDFTIKGINRYINEGAELIDFGYFMFDKQEYEIHFYWAKVLTNGFEFFCLSYLDNFDDQNFSNVADLFNEYIFKFNTIIEQKDYVILKSLLDHSICVKYRYCLQNATIDDRSSIVDHYKFYSLFNDMLDKGFDLCEISEVVHNSEELVLENCRI